MKQTVYIYKCDNSTVQVKGKVNAITIGKLKLTVIVSFCFLLVNRLACIDESFGKYDI